jgi:hypothetical protein
MFFVLRSCEIIQQLQNQVEWNLFIVMLDNKKQNLFRCSPEI